VTTTVSAQAGIDRREAIRRGVLLLAGVVAAPAIGAIGACTVAGPRAIAYGRDECAYCHMVVSDSRFAATMVTAKGRTLAFDSIECLAASWVQSRRAFGHDAARSLWVSDYAHPGQIITAERARFVRVDGPGSPMGKGLMAFRTDAEARRISSVQVVSSWAEVVALVEREGMARGAVTGNVPAASGGARAID
jgi:copper chaperone NosL